MEAKKTYKIVNTTRFPGARNGKHRLGFFVEVVKGRPIGPMRHITVNDITPGMLAYQSKGWIAIQEIKNPEDEINKHIEEGNKERAIHIKRTVQETLEVKKQELAKVTAEAKALEKPVEEVSTPDSSMSKDDIKNAVKASRGEETKAIVSMGDSKDLVEEDDAVFANGEPNFIVQAGKKNKKR